MTKIGLDFILHCVREEYDLAVMDHAFDEIHSDKARHMLEIIDEWLACGGELTPSELRAYETTSEFVESVTVEVNLRKNR